MFLSKAKAKYMYGPKLRPRHRVRGMGINDSENSTNVHISDFYI